MNTNRSDMPPPMKSDQELLAELQQWGETRKKSVQNTLENNAQWIFCAAVICGVGVTLVFDLNQTWVENVLIGVVLAGYACLSFVSKWERWAQKLAGVCWNTMYAKKHHENLRLCVEKVQQNDWNDSRLQSVWPNAQEYARLTTTEMAEMAQHLHNAPPTTRSLWANMFCQNKPVRKAQESFLRALQQQEYMQLSCATRPDIHAQEQREAIQQWAADIALEHDEYAHFPKSRVLDILHSPIQSDPRQT